MDASLMTFDNEYDRIISTNYMKTIGISFDYKFFGGVWMGINCLGKSRQFVASHDGGRVPFVKWLPLQPDNANGRSTEECVAYSDVNGYGFNDDSCATAHQYVCQIVVLSLIVGLQAWGCPAGFKKVGEKCYSGSLEKVIWLMVFISTTNYYKKHIYLQVNWFEADRRCRAMHASLMIFDDENDRKISTNYMKDIGISFADNYNGGVWIGINCFGNDRQFVASHDGSAVPFEKWIPTQPDNNGNEECIAYSDVKDYGFNDLTCTHKHQFVCQTRFKYY
ncbi:maker473 [Drosophila busckii]|uniref:Maker473 n=1 Tax=Drosophila busckii TaxID=30019 RepID=A0A0M4EQY0_DROBS|nr:maker473 [Drosophila busckii]